MATDARYFSKGAPATRMGERPRKRTLSPEQVREAFHYQTTECTPPKGTVDVMHLNGSNKAMLLHTYIAFVVALRRRCRSTIVPVCTQLHKLHVDTANFLQRRPFCESAPCNGATPQTRRELPIAHWPRRRQSARQFEENSVPDFFPSLIRQPPNRR